jgi:sporulation related protein
MSDGRAYDEQGLPWLEAVDDEDGARGVSAGKMLAAVALVLLAAAIVAGTFFWLGKRDPTVVGAPQLIRAQPGPYKVRPDDPGGLDVAGDSGTAFATGAGEDTDAALDPSKLPPPPPAVAPPEAEPAPKKLPPNETKVPANDQPAPPAGAAGPTVQLGAYASTIKAETAWGMLSGRFPEVAALRKQVVAATVGGKTIYRLRAGGSTDATRAACAALKAAGESCLVVN